MARRGSGYVRWMNDDWQLFVGGVFPTLYTSDKNTTSKGEFTSGYFLFVCFLGWLLKCTPLENEGFETKNAPLEVVETSTYYKPPIFLGSKLKFSGVKLGLFLLYFCRNSGKGGNPKDNNTSPRKNRKSTKNFHNNNPNKKMMENCRSLFLGPLFTFQGRTS